VQLQGAAIRQQMKALRAKYQEIIIDVGGRDTGSLRAALTISDAILIPFQPRSVDLWAGAQIGSLVVEARAVNDLKAYAVINAADAQGRDNDDALAVLQSIEGIRAIGTAIVRRKAFPNAFSAGLSVVEQHPQDPKAVAELLSIVDTLYAHRVGNDYQDAIRQAG
jgi:chromosome partitioning protein